MRKLQHNDEPVMTGGALLNRDRFVKSLAEQIAGCTPPQVFGVHGEWGAGKTSVLKQIQRHLSEPTTAGAVRDKTSPADDANVPLPSAYWESTFTIWFEAWRYQHEAVPIIALLHEMRSQFSLAMQAKNALKAGGVIALKTLTGAFDTVASVIGGESGKLLNPGNILKAGEAYDAAHLRAKLPTETMREFLEQAIGELLVGLKRKPDRNPRLVIFIDDLDRCSSESAYRLLEGLKIHLNLPNCVFVLGMNQGAVIDLLTPHFSKKGDDELAERRAESYLEKLCANVWRLPPMTDPLMLLTHWLYVDKDEIGDKVLQDRMKLIANAEVLKRSLPPNPRKLKALANTLLTLWEGGAKDHLPERDSLILQCFLFVAYVYQFHQALYQRWVLEPSFFEAMRDWAQGLPLPSATTTEPPLLAAKRAIFANLRLTALPPLSGTGDDKSIGSSVSAQPSQSLYPEPGQHGLFWMTPWLLHADGGRLAKSDVFVPLLCVHRVQ
jgi:hypothetical protein